MLVLNRCMPYIPRNARTQDDMTKSQPNAAEEGFDVVHLQVEELDATHYAVLLSIYPDW
jgi:hypothetical protein